MSVEYYDDSLDSDSHLPQYARITFFDQQPFIMQKERVIIGRNSAAGSVDIDVGAVTFVSRKHLELTYSYQKLKVKCLGKNGIFIDNNFKSHSFIPYELPPKCSLRFPSTDVQFCVEQLVEFKCANRLGSFARMKCNVRYISDNDESPDYKRMKMNSRSEHDSTSNDNQEISFQGFREVIGNITDNEVEEYIHNEEDDDPRKISNSDCDGLMNDTNGENDGVIIDNIGSYSFNTNGSLHNLSKEYSLDNMKSNEMTPTNILRGIDNQSSVSTRPSVTKLVFNNIHCSSDQFYSNEGQITVLDQDDLTIEHGSDTQKPPYSYAQLIVQAVSTARDRQLTLNGIYNYISKNYPYFKVHDKGWQNSVRHNLSLNRYFIKVPRGQDEPGKGSFWRVDPTYESKLISQAFRKRRLRNNTNSIANENGIMSQVLNVSNIDSGSQSSNTKLFGLSKPCHLATSRSPGFSNVITLKRASDLSTQNGATTYMLSSGQGLSSSTEPHKYVVAGRGAHNPGYESLATVTAGKAGTLFKCQAAPKSVFIDGSTGLSGKGRSVQIRSQSGGGGGNSGTLISLGGRLFSTANIKSLQIHQQQQSQPATARLLNHSSFESRVQSSAPVTGTLHPKGNSYYIISPTSLKGQKSINSSSSFDENQSAQPQISLSGPSRRIISIQSSQSPKIQKIDLSNGAVGKESPLKSPIILKKIKISSGGAFVGVPEGEPPSPAARISGAVTKQRPRRYGGLYGEEEGDLDPGDLMDHFLLPQTDPPAAPAPSRPPPQARSEACSSPDVLYKHEDDLWPEEELGPPTKIDVHKFGGIPDDGLVDPDCD